MRSLRSPTQTQAASRSRVSAAGWGSVTTAWRLPQSWELPSPEEDRRCSPGMLSDSGLPSASTGIYVSISAASRTAGFDIVQESFENRIEIFGPFPKWGVPQPVQAMTAAFPQIGIRDGIEVIEINDAIRAAVHHCERDRTALHDQTLIHALSGTRGLEEPLAKTAVCTRDGIPEEWLGRVTENAFNKSVDFCLRQLLLACDA